MIAVEMNLALERIRLALTRFDLGSADALANADDPGSLVRLIEAAANGLEGAADIIGLPRQLPEAQPVGTLSVQAATLQDILGG